MSDTTQAELELRLDRRLRPKGECALDYVTLGPLAAIDHDGPRPLGGLRQRTVLAVLLVSAERTVSVDELIDHVWDGQPPPKPLVSLRATSRTFAASSAATDARTAWSPTRTDTDSTFLATEWMPVCSRMGWPRQHLLEAGDAAAATRELTTASTAGGACPGRIPRPSVHPSRDPSTRGVAAPTP